MIRAGLIINPKSHRNRRAGGRRGHAPGGVLTAAPQTPAELDAALADFAARGIDLLIIDGGDGTLRDVLTLAPLHFGDAEPAFAALPSGKTNALAIALNTPRDWPIEAALARAQAGAFTPLSPLEVRRARERKPPQRGFLFGAGAFRRATADAEAAHRLGAFGSLAIGLTLAGSVLQTLAGRGGWATGEPMTLALDGETPNSAELFLLMASTLERFPLGLRPLGSQPGPLRTLTVAAPPQRLLAALPAVLSGRQAAWLEGAGYGRRSGTCLTLTLKQGFVLDGEIYPGGSMTVRAGPPLRFVAP